MSAQGFDTWTLEVRGAGLSTYADSVEEDEESLKKSSETDSSNNNGKSSDFERTLGFKNLSASFESEVSQMKRSGSEAGELRPTTSFMEIVTRRLQTMIGGQNRFTTTLEELKKQIDCIVKYEWDFDHYLEEDIPAVVRWTFHCDALFLSLAKVSLFLSSRVLVYEFQIISLNLFLKLFC
jgi:hypothetical protein